MVPGAFNVADVTEARQQQLISHLQSTKTLTDMSA